MFFPSPKEGGGDGIVKKKWGGMLCITNRIVNFTGHKGLSYKDS